MLLNLNALTTVEQVREFLNLNTDTGPSNDQLVLLINQSSDAIEKALGYSLRLEERTEYYEGTDIESLFLKHRPVQDIQELLVADQDYLPLLITGELRINDVKSGLVFVKGNTWYGSYSHRGLTPVRSNHWRGYPIKITYTAGYVLPNEDNPPNYPRTLPYDLERACLLMISEAYNTDASVGLSKFSIGDVKWEFDRTSSSSNQSPGSGSNRGYQSILKTYLPAKGVLI